MKLMACAVMAMSLAAGAAQAADWRLVTINNGGAFGIDYNSIRPEARGISAWILTVTAKVNEEGVSFMMLRTHFDCEREETAFSSIVDYAEDGTNLSSLTGAKEWKPVIPDSVGYMNMRAACFRETYGNEGWASAIDFVSAYRAVQD